VECSITNFGYLAVFTEQKPTQAPATTQPTTFYIDTTTQATQAAVTTVEPSKYVEVKFPGTCSDYYSESTKAAFETEMKTKLAAQIGVPAGRLSGVTASCGSVLVGFNIGHDTTGSSLSVAAAVSALQSKVQGGTLVITLASGQSLTADTSYFVARAAGAPAVEKKEGGIGVGAIAGIAVGCIVLLILVIVIMITCKKKTKTAISVTPTPYASVLHLKDKDTEANRYNGTSLGTTSFAPKIGYDKEIADYHESAAAVPEAPVSGTRGVEAVTATTVNM